MSEHTPNLSLPLLMPSQAQKHVTHNEALCMLDMLCQLSAKDVHVDNAPITPAQGDVYLLGSAPTGDWNGQAHAIAAYDGVGWRFVTPRTGWRAFVESSGGRLMYFNGANWVALEAAGGGGGSGDGGGTFDGEVAALGIGTPADPATPFLAELNTGRFTARDQNDGGTGSMTLALNKTGAGSDVGIVFEDDATPFARLGRFASPTTDLAVSADGTNFLTAFAIDPLNGSVRQPGLPRFKAVAGTDILLSQNTWDKLDVDSVLFNDQGAFDSATSLFTAPVSGTYSLGGKLLFKTNGSTSVRMQGRFVRNGTDEIEASFCENSTQPVDLRSTLEMNNLVQLAAGDTVELQGRFHGYSDAYFAAGGTAFWAYMVG